MKINKSIKLLLGVLAIGISGCTHRDTIKVKEKIETQDIDEIGPDDISEPESFNPITDEIKLLAATKAPTVDPSTVIFSKEDSYVFNSQAYLDVDMQSNDVSIREGHSLIYFFEGKCSEGYQGSYYSFYTNVYLWDDGFATGISNTETFKGYWYNDENGDGKVTDEDKLGIVCDPVDYIHYSTIICTKEDRFYEWTASMYINTGWGDRSVYIYGYTYYETIAIAIDSNKTGTKFKVGDEFDVNTWGVFEVHQNLKYGYVFERDDDETKQIKWNIPDGLIVDGKMAKTGTYPIKASFNNFEASITVVVK